MIFTLQRYGIDALGAMAQGLFCTLLVGTILNTIGTQFGIAFLQDAIVSIGKGEGAVSYTIGGLCSAMVGPGMAVAIGRALEAPPLVLYSLIPVGFATNFMGGAGGPLAVLFVAILASEIGKAVSKETKVDILVTPIVTVLSGIGIAALIAAPIGAAASAVGRFIMWATELQPFFMGIIVSVVIGVALTLPISSAAICAALGLTGLAGGAAVAGCCAQMIGFAVMSFRENRWGGLAAQGLGTSMLQMGNIVRNPRIWIPPTLASAITGPIATCLFRLEMNGAAVSSGMGTCGLVGLNYCSGFLDNQPEESLCRSTVALMAKHAAHFKKVGGIEIIGLGSDFDGIGGELEMDDCSKLPLLAEALRREGFTEDEVERVFYRNAQRFFEDNL